MKWIKQIFCKHDWIRLDSDPMPKIEKGVRINMIKNHECSKCELTKMIGSGWIM